MKLAQKLAHRKASFATIWLAPFRLHNDSFTSRSKRGLPHRGAKMGSILSQPGER
jgi:hypothetical protein